MTQIQTIESLAALDELLERSKQQPVWVFKHSMTCGISSTAWAEFRRFAEQSAGDETVYAIIEVQNARAVSSALAERIGVRHQTPQAILLRDAQAAWHASHYEIRVQALKKA
jgi:bacillithiol system protein YtxJ